MKSNQSLLRSATGAQSTIPFTSHRNSPPYSEGFNPRLLVYSFLFNSSPDSPLHLIHKHRAEVTHRQPTRRHPLLRPIIVPSGFGGPTTNTRTTPYNSHTTPTPTPTPTLHLTSLLSTFSDCDSFFEAAPPGSNRTFVSPILRLRQLEIPSPAAVAAPFPWRPFRPIRYPTNSSTWSKAPCPTFPLPPCRPLWPW